MAKTSNPHSEKSCILIELNEFNYDLMKTIADEESFESIKKLLSLKTIATKTDDSYESERLEPWVQWISVHTGQTSLQHSVRHLGDVPDLQVPQLWETLSKNGISSGIWGVLNGNRGQAENCQFFLPDPWTFSEQAHPRNLNPLLEFPRYIATNRSNFSPLKFARLLFAFGGKLVFNFSALKDLVWILPRFLKMVAKYPKAEFVGYCPFEYFSGMLFLKFYKREKPAFGAVFLNMIAHLQHYYWDFSIPGNRDKLVYGFKFVDKLLEHFFNEISPGTQIYVANALSQANTNHEKPWVSYRPVKFETVLDLLQVPYKEVNALMSYDATASFESEEKCRQAKKILDETTILGQPLFYTELNLHTPTRLFFRTGFYDEVFAPTEFKSQGKSFSFQDNFIALAVRTAKHVPRGTLLTTDPAVQGPIYNHQIYDTICRFFGISVPQQTSSQPSL